LALSLFVFMHKDLFRIQGLSGKRSLEGEIAVGGAKNAVLKSMSSTVLFSGPVRFERTPEIEDVSRLAEIIEGLGPRVERSAGGAMRIDGASFDASDIDTTLGKRLRASVVLTGPLLARFGRVSFPHPGGCVIGARPIDLFLENFVKMGASVTEKDGRFILKAKKGKLSGADIFFRVQSVTATESFMMAATLASGTTTLRNCAMEPEIEHLAEFLNDSGAVIRGAGTPTIVIEGGQLLVARSPYTAMPDRIEAGSFLILAALAGKDVSVTQCNPKHFEIVTELLRQSGVPVEVGENFARVRTTGRKAPTLLPLSIRTHEYPGFPTDVQAPMVVYLSQATGESSIFETIFEGRLRYTEDLVRMGADIRMFDTQRAVIKGATPLRGKELESPDIRAGLAYVIAGIIADGISTIRNAYYVDRGYERIEERLRAIGADIVRVRETCEPLSTVEPKKE
jgi:UDP-N-acetylglucosamine 1-carboxyvinyltransferase